VVGGGRAVMRLKVIMLAHGMLHRMDRDRLAAFMATKPTGGTVLHPDAKRRGRSASGGWQRPAILPRDGKRPKGRTGK
jgi:hypothetical protein